MTIGLETVESIRSDIGQRPTIGGGRQGVSSCVGTIARLYQSSLQSWNIVHQFGRVQVCLSSCYNFNSIDSTRLGYRLIGREAAEHLLTALNQQAAARGIQGQQTNPEAMSDTIWSTFRLVVSLMHKNHLYEAVENRFASINYTSYFHRIIVFVILFRNLDVLNREFEME